MVMKPIFPRVLSLCVLIVVVPGCAGDGAGQRLSSLGSRVQTVARQRRAAPPRRSVQPRSHRWYELASARAGQTALPTGGQHAPDDTGRARAGLPATDLPAQPGGSGPLPGLWDTVKRDLRSMPGDLWADTKAVYAAPLNLAVLGVSYGGSLALQETGPDDTVEDAFRGEHHSFDAGWRETFSIVGHPGTHFGLASLWYLLGQQTQNEKTYEVGKTLFSGLIINGVSTLAGKAATWEDGPDGEWGTLPSGHTSSSFTFASVMHRAYGPWVGAPLYVLGTLVAYERVESEAHYLSDVVMGGVLGLVIGHSVAGEHGFELFGGQIVPYVDPYTGSSGLAWVRHIK